MKVKEILNKMGAGEWVMARSAYDRERLSEWYSPKDVSSLHPMKMRLFDYEVDAIFHDERGMVLLIDDQKDFLKRLSKRIGKPVTIGEDRLKVRDILPLVDSSFRLWTIEEGEILYREDGARMSTSDKLSLDENLLERTVYSIEAGRSASGCPFVQLETDWEDEEE